MTILQHAEILGADEAWSRWWTWTAMVWTGSTFLSPQRLMAIWTFDEIEASLRSYAKLLRIGIVENDGVIVATSNVRETDSTPSKATNSTTWRLFA